MSTFRILVADDHPVFRFGLCTLLETRAGWEVCGEAADGREAVEKCRQLKPDLLILDICLPELNGVDAARQILKDNPDQVILVLTSVDSEQVVRDCLEAGVRGWVFKSDRIDDVITAVEALQRRRSIFSLRVSNLIVDGHKRHGADPLEANLPKLSAREREVVQLVSEGRASKEIAAILNVTLGTAETHRSNILRKLQLHSIAELVLYAVRNEIVHVQFPRVLTIPGQGEERTRERASSDFTALSKHGNGPVEVVRKAVN